MQRSAEEAPPFDSMDLFSLWSFDHRRHQNEVNAATLPGPPNHTEPEGELLEDVQLSDVAEVQSERPQTHSFLPTRTWRQRDGLDLELELRKPVRTVREVPRWFKGCVLQAYSVALRQWHRDRTAASWKLVVLVPRMLLQPTLEHGKSGKGVFHDRMRRFNQGEWLGLLKEAADNEPARASRELDAETAAEKRREQAEVKVRLREVRRARLLLTSNGLAPGSSETLTELTDEALRPRELSEVIPDNLLGFVPDVKVKLDKHIVLEALRSAGRGSAQDLAGTRYEHLRVVLDDEEVWDLLVQFLEAFARAEVPADVAAALRLGRLTALKKDNGRVRGIVAGSVHRRLACKALAKQFSEEFLAATAPYQFALQTRAGTEALAHALRFLTDSDPDVVVLSLDGVGAFDHVKRAAFFKKLHSVESLQPLLSVVQMLYGQESRFLWTDDAGETHIIRQAEGGEQGDPLMPALFALAQHDALVAADGELLPDEHVFSFLDDLYVTTSKARAFEAFEAVSSSVERHAGVRVHLGKLKAWCKRGGEAPEGLENLRGDNDEPVWQADKPDAQNGLVVLGTPLGTDAFVEHHADKRLEIEQRLLDELPKLSDLQCSWVLLSQCAVPRANHTVRILPPTLSRCYATKHDAALWATFCKVFGVGSLADDGLAKDVATLPGRLGGLGLRSAIRSGPAAYWASWVNALPVFASKLPRFCNQVLRALVAGNSDVLCLRELELCAAELVQAGTTELPTWVEAAEGAVPPKLDEGLDAADFDRGWQCHATSFLENSFLKSVVLPASDRARRTLLLSQADSGACAFLRAVPTEAALTFSPLRLQTSVRRRLRWPLPLSGGQCSRCCASVLDEKGDHAATCHLAGRLTLRARPLEKTWARVLREAGARVRERVFLRDAAVPGIVPSDGRHIEIVASGLPFGNGVPVAVDATLVSPLHANGIPFARADVKPGVALARAEKAKRDKYPELVGSPVLRLVTVASETGGRFNGEAYKLLDAAATAKVRSLPRPLQASAARAWRARWLTLLSVSVQCSLAATLVNEGTATLDAVDGGVPDPVQVWLDGTSAYE